MMKSNRVKLAEWVSSDVIIDIDWPKIQKMLGQEHIDWLLTQPRDRCQLVVDNTGDVFALVAEFYNEQAHVDYWLRWAR